MLTKGRAFGCELFLDEVIGWVDDLLLSGDVGWKNEQVWGSEVLAAIPTKGQELVIQRRGGADGCGGVAVAKEEFYLTSVRDNNEGVEELCPNIDPKGVGAVVKEVEKSSAFFRCSVSGI